MAKKFFGSKELIGLVQPLATVWTADPVTINPFQNSSSSEEQQSNKEKPVPAESIHDSHNSRDSEDIPNFEVVDRPDKPTTDNPFK